MLSDIALDEGMCAFLFLSELVLCNEDELLIEDAEAAEAEAEAAVALVPCFTGPVLLLVCCCNLFCFLLLLRPPEDETEAASLR